MKDIQQKGNKLVKRRPVASPTRDRRSSANNLSWDTPAAPPLPTDEYIEPTAMHSNTSSADKEKRSKWRLSNPFHSKDKDRHDAADSTKDSAYGSNDASSRSDVNSSGIPSYSSTERRGSDPNFSVTGEQSRPEPTVLQGQTPTTNIIPPTPPTHGNNASPHRLEENALPKHENNVPYANQSKSLNTPENNASLGHSVQAVHSHVNQKSQENISKETHEDIRTGNIVTVTTTTTTTTTTTSGPGGSTTVQVPTAQQATAPPEENITSTSGPSPPAPAHVQPHINFQQGLSHPPEPNHDTPFPIFPGQNNTRNRVELDSVSPGVERSNPMANSMVSPVTPTSPTRNNFSYPARIPPAGVPRQVPVQYFPGQQQNDCTQQNQGYQQPQQLSYGESYNAHPAPLRAGHTPQQSQQPHVSQRQSTFANLRTAAAGIHGAGEALRGTLNNSVDKRFANPNSTVHAKNQAVIDAGRSEVETGRSARHQHQSPSAPAPYLPTLQTSPNAKTAYNGPPVSGSQIEDNSGSSGGGRLDSFVKKLKEGPLANERTVQGGDGRLRVVNE